MLPTAAEAEDFDCPIPWYSGARCDKKFSIPVQEKVTIQVTSWTDGDGNDVGRPCPQFQIVDANTGTNLHQLTLCKDETGEWKNDKEKPVIVELKVNVSLKHKRVVRGNYKVAK